MARKQEFLDRWTRSLRVEAARRGAESFGPIAAGEAADRSPAGRARAAPSSRSDVPPGECDPAAPGFSGTPSFYIFIEGEFFALLSLLCWNPQQPERGTSVPKGFVTDFASVPRLFWSWLPPLGQYGYPALLHDFAYWRQDATRAEADRLFRQTMEALAVSWFKRWILYGTVRIFGFVAWRQNTRARANGDRRILRVLPSGAVAWGAWRQEPDVFDQHF